MSAATKELLRESVLESASDPAYFCRFFLRHWFPSEMPWFHLGMLALITRKVSFLDKYPEHHEMLLEYFKYVDPTDPRAEHLLPVFSLDGQGRMCMQLAPNNNFIIPRGFSKTTICNAANLYNVVTDPLFFGAYVSNTTSHAQTQLGNIRHELENNANLRAAYGDIVPDRSDSEKWTAGELQTTTGAILIARGRGSQIRGVNFRARRPNVILCDDVEDEESVSTDEQREKTRKWFYGGVAPAGNEMDGANEETGQESLQIINLGTLLDSDALAMTLAKDIEFNTIRFGAQLRSGVMLWPYKMREETYARKRSRYQRLGRLDEFSREYDSSIRVSEDALFTHHNVTLYEPVLRANLLDVAIAMDPAISKREKADEAAISVTGRGPNGKLYVLECWGKRGATPRELIDKFFALHILWSPDKHGIEANGYQAALVFLMREEMARRRLFFNIEAITQNEDKDQRIKGILQARYANGYVRHRKPFPELEIQLEDFPNGKKDRADATAMAFKLMGETAFVAAAGDDLASMFDDEYPPLDECLPPLYSGQYIFNTRPDPLRGRYG